MTGKVPLLPEPGEMPAGQAGAAEVRVGVPRHPDPSSLIGSVVDGRFRVLREIGRGGMGVVLEVRDLAQQLACALKVIHWHFLGSKEVSTRFVREASAAGAIQSPHVVRIHEAGRLSDGRAYLLMELLDGVSLRSRVQQRGRLGVGEALEICYQAARGLAAAHAVGVIHRDVKPDNLLALRRSEECIKILDFGISKVLSGDDVPLTQQGRLLGTYCYMSPEQMKGASDVDERTDVYSVGVVLYECLTGHPPFYADSIPRLMQLMAEGKFAPVEPVRPEAPRGLDAILARCLARNRAERFGGMEELCRALERLIEGRVFAQPMVAVGPEPPEPSRRPWVDMATVVPRSSS